MRENMGLFKAKRTDNGEWLEGGYFKSWTGTKYEHKIHDGLYVYDVDPETVCECTGLVSKTKAPIFENDKFGGIYEGLVIKWCDKCKQFTLFGIDDFNECFQCMGDINWFELASDEALEVVGNTHDQKGGEST